MWYRFSLTDVINATSRHITIYIHHGAKYCTIQPHVTVNPYWPAFKSNNTTLTWINGFYIILFISNWCVVCIYIKLYTYTIQHIMQTGNYPMILKSVVLNNRLNFSTFFTQCRKYFFFSKILFSFYVTF